MADPRQSLTVYQIRPAFVGRPYKEALRKDVRALIGATERPRVVVHLVRGGGKQRFNGQLFVHYPRPKTPAWARFVKHGVDKLEVERTSTPSAVLLVQIVDAAKQKHRFAFTFGFGRYLLDPAAYRRGVGLKVALNAIYEKGAPQTMSRVRSVDMKTVDAATFRTRRQASRKVTFDEFGVDINRDLLSAITGEPRDDEQWGTRVTGSDALRSNAIRSFSEIGKLCHRIVGFERRDDYKHRFEWVDKVQAIQNPILVGKLEEQLVAILEEMIDMSSEERDQVRVDLAPAELVDWSEIAAFRYSLKADRYEDLEVGDYLDLVKSPKGGGIDLDRLRQDHRVVALKDSDDKLGSWSIYRCLDAELELDGETYLLVDGQFYGIDGSYMDRLNRDVGELNEWAIDLIEWNPALKRDGKKWYEEGDYNADAADKSNHFLNLDAQPVFVPEATSGVEVCDILTSDGDFVHVKRKLRSSALSHLFGQGAVSAELFRRSVDYRKKTLELVHKVFAESRPGASLASGFAGPFAGFDPEDPISPSDYRVVYAIIAEWRKPDRGKKTEVERTLVDALPFFSKVNLRRHASALAAVGFKVAYKRVRYKR